MTRPPAFWNFVCSPFFSLTFFLISRSTWSANSKPLWRVGFCRCFLVFPTGDGKVGSDGRRGCISWNWENREGSLGNDIWGRTQRKNHSIILFIVLPPNFLSFSCAFIMSSCSYKFSFYPSLKRITVAICEYIPIKIQIRESWTLSLICLVCIFLDLYLYTFHIYQSRPNFLVFLIACAALVVLHTLFCNFCFIY